MPMKPAKPCKHPGCPNLTHENYCVEHKSLYIRDSSSGRGYDYKWRKLRKRFLQAHPLCEQCKRDSKLVGATVVDHIVPHCGDPKLMWDECNWQALCRHCHDKKTGKYDTKKQYKF